MLKSDYALTFGLCDASAFQSFFDALKKSCVLGNFYGAYEVVRLLGKGHFASVYLVKSKESSELFAAKIISKRSENFAVNKAGFLLIPPLKLRFVGVHR